MKLEKAVILVAGSGERLRPLTDKIPKCFLEVQGKPILTNMLEILSKHGFKEITLAVGHLSSYIIKRVGYNFGNLKIKYVLCREYRRTNNMYSLHLSEQELKGHPFLLIEGDCFFGNDIMEKIIADAKQKISYWIVDSKTVGLNGCMLYTSSNGYIVNIKIAGHKNKKNRFNRFKSAGLVIFCKEDSEKIFDKLKKETALGKTGIYYDLAIRKYLSEFSIKTIDITGYDWIEIDDFYDFKKAKDIFQKDCTK